MSTKVIKRTPDLGIRIRLQPVSATPTDKPAPSAPVPAGGCDVTGVAWASPVLRNTDDPEYPYLFLPQLDSAIDYEAPDITRVRSWVAGVFGSDVSQAVGFAVGPATAGVRWEVSVTSTEWPGSDTPLRAAEWDYYTVEVYGPVVVVTQLAGPIPYDAWHADITLSAFCGAAPVGTLVWRIHYNAF